MYENTFCRKERWSAMKYIVFYKDIKIGVLEIKNKGQHKDTPDKIGTQKVKDSISIFYEMLVESDWREPIPFFANRINDAKRFLQDNDISNQTDPFRMIRED